MIGAWVFYRSAALWFTGYIEESKAAPLPDLRRDYSGLFTQKDLARKS